ncbi:MAG: EamA family transporter [Candidatus Pacebacteria bacterium]|nr:EamA family transporter [Candidatus Paceibacterota bacterium]
MDLWLILAIVGQVLMAVVALVDKYVITSTTVALRPLSYAFWISILSSGSIVAFFFSWLDIPIDGLSIPSFANIEAPSLLVFALSVTAGYSFFTALVSFFHALQQSDASDVAPVVGGLNAFFTLLLSYFFLEGRLPGHFMLGFGLLVVGTIIVSRFRFSKHTMLSVMHAGLMYGIHYIAIKALFDATNFETAFFWSRVAIVGVALSMLLIPEYYENIVGHTKRARVRDGAFVFGNKLLAGIASLILLKAIEHGDVALVQALGGVQYLFLLGVSVCCGRALSRDAGENLTLGDFLHKAISIPLIAFGFFLMFL